MYKPNSRLYPIKRRLAYGGYRIKKVASKLRARLFALRYRSPLMREGYLLKRPDGITTKIYRIENPRMKAVAKACASCTGKKCFRSDKPRHVVVFNLAGVNVFAIYRSKASFSWLSFVLSIASSLDSVLFLADAIMFDGQIYLSFSDECSTIFEAVRLGLNPNIVKLL